MGEARAVALLMSMMITFTKEITITIMKCSF
jgi:hypothetical protein